MAFFRHAEPNYPARVTSGDNIALHAELALADSHRANLGTYAVSRHREDEQTFVLQRQTRFVPGWLRTQIVVQPDAAQGGYTVGTLSAGHRLFSRVFRQPDLPTAMADEDAAIVSANVGLDQEEAEVAA